MCCILSTTSISVETLTAGTECLRRVCQRSLWARRGLFEAQVVAHYRALYFEHWPDYIRLEKYTPTRTLRSSNETKLTVPLIKETFQDSAAEVFNSLPVTIRNCTDFTTFKRKARAHLRNIASARLVRQNSSFFFRQIVNFSFLLFCIYLLSFYLNVGMVM